MGISRDKNPGIDSTIGHEVEIETLLEEPKMYRVLLLNDDWTAMDFVVGVLMDVFDKSSDEATAIMLEVHNNGKGSCGIYTYDIAELKTQIVKEKAQSYGYPLRVITEEIS